MSSGLNLSSVPEDLSQASVLAASQRLVGYVSTTRDHNNAAWLDGLARELNRWAAIVGDPTRVQHVNGELRQFRVVG